ncbi:hypothetical protein BsWGS_23565 [Bradybaena similaris]
MVKAPTLLALLVVVCLWCLYHGRDNKVGRYTRWLPGTMPEPDAKARYFVPVRGQPVFMYSAIANLHQPVDAAINIIITTLSASRQSLQCCVLLDGKSLFVTPAEEFFQYHNFDVAFIAKILEYFSADLYYARQYSCSVPDTGHSAGHVTLTSSVCSPDIEDFLQILYPPRVPGGLALCAKIAYNGGHDPEKVIEWVEVQLMLGVDKILIFDLGNPENLTRVFRYYQSLGVLDVQPYELPGSPANRTLWGADTATVQFHHDESMAVLECNQRMSGYTFVMSHDVDEFIIPRRDVTLKQFFKEKMETYQDGAGFFFEAEFFVYEWGPSHPKEDLMVSRYRRATKPHWECTKYMFLPHRTRGTITHTFFPLPPYRTYILGSEEAVIHHYRRCPHVWSSCDPETIIDNSMARFRGLHERVVKVRAATNVRPDWTPEVNLSILP